ncbi:TPA: DUF2800 domain-containing protein [Enterococcus faecalis]|uniref:DUF2800 domain-containing protein n=1 Tax=Streptococcus dysgalactiae TaxID=1334 RepID=UPI0023DD97C2|nr:DUF2800 domain-containing protein [Streptococcus dysgalactiae]WEQ78274.1 DUF2800 domain-containing protein [Streptococcus dysgalactiae subsp. equisimilis]HEO2154587.1 DUF2800 domain-containing protein [Streptococcus agalactiae]HEP7759324.1 DUF2800 domain-containing protein [Streptococcus pyogenes]HEP7761025.1 DUF2800 domain-containing protein [Streptococcus pyogenes]
MPNKHALLSASSAYRWLACPPSALLSAKYEDTSSSYAQEGTAAHALAEYKVLKALGRKADDPTENLDYFNEEMDEATDAYAGYVLEQVAEAKKATTDPIVLVEQRVDFSTYVPDGFGTADALIIADDKLSITDLKYGRGVLVEADHNPQLMCYALGAYEMFSALYDIETVSMTIFQPRRDNVSVFEMKASDLLDWAENTLKPKAELAAEGKGDFTAGEHCRFCKAKADCRARAEANLALARYDFALPPTLTDADIEAILPLLDELTSWAEDIKAYALTRAVAGKEWHGYKLVAGRSNRKYVNEDAVAKKVSDAGFNPYEEKLLGITAMTKLLGKNRFEELLSSLIEKPQGKPTLVPESDKRPAMNSAKEDFKEEN